MKLIFFGGILIFLGLIGAVVVGPHYLDWNNHTQTIAKQIAKMAGVPGATITGPVNIKIFPQPKVSIAKLELHPHQGAQPLATIEGFESTLSWAGFWAFGIRFEEVKASKIHLHLVQLDAQNTNYQPKRRARQLSTNTPSSLYPIHSLGQIHVESVQVQMEDKATNTHSTFVAENIFVDGSNLSNTQLKISGAYNQNTFTLQGQLDLSALRQIQTNLTLGHTYGQLTLKGTVFDPLFKPMYTGDINLNATSPQKLRALLSKAVPQTQIPESLEEFSFSATGMISAEKTLFNDALIRAKQNEKWQTLEGELLFEQQAAQKPARLDVNLKGRDLDLDTFLGTSQNTTKTKKKSTKWSATPFDLSPLGKFAFNLEFDGQKIRFYQQDFDALKLKINNEKGTLTLNELSAHAQTGTIKLSGTYNYLVSNPKLQAHLSAREMPLQHLFTSPLKGNLSANADLSANGISQKELMQTLAGKGNAHVTQGALMGIKLQNTVTAMQQIFGSGKSNASTTFADMKLSFTIKNGTLINEDFYLDTNAIDLKANGKIDLANWTINARVHPENQQGLARFLVPVRVSGSLSAPTVLPLATSPAGKGAAIGAALGGPVGAGLGAIIGSQLSKDSKKPTPPESKPANEAEPATDLFPFSLEKITPESVRQFLSPQ